MNQFSRGFNFAQKETRNLFPAKKKRYIYSNIDGNVQCNDFIRGIIK